MAGSDEEPVNVEPRKLRKKRCEEELKLRVHYGPAFCTLEFPDARLPFDFDQAFTVPNPDYRAEYLDPEDPTPMEFKFFDTENNYIYTGLVYAAVDWAQKKGLVAELVDFPFDPWEGDVVEEVSPDIISGIILRDYQCEAIQACVSRWRGVVEIATGGGKTEIAIGIILTLKKPKTIFLAPGVDSMDGMYERFLARGFVPGTDVGRYGDDIDDLDADPAVIVSSVQSLYAGIKKSDQRVLDRLKDCELFIADEVHHKATALSWKAVAVFCNAHRRIGLSATPYKREESRFNPADLHGHDSWVVGLVGDTLYYKPAAELQAQGDLAKCQVISFQAAVAHSFSDKWQEVYNHCIVKNDARNFQIAVLAANLADMGRRPLVSVTILEHGRRLQWLLYYQLGVLSACSYGQGVTYIPKALADALGLAYEGIPVYDRRPTIKEKKAGKQPKIKGYETDFVQIPEDVCVRTLVRQGIINVLIGSSIYDESADIPQLTDLINAAGGKAQQRLRQKVGRILRLDGTNSVAWIWEPWDASHYYLTNHSKKRIQNLQQQGFPLFGDWGFSRIFHTSRLKDVTCKEVSMKYDKLSITTSMTVPLPNYANVKPSVTLSAILEEGDDPVACADKLSALTMAMFYREAWRLVQEQGALSQGGGGYQAFWQRATEFLQQFAPPPAQQGVQG